MAPAGVCPAPWQLVANMALDHYGAAGASNGTYSYHAGGYSFSSGITLDVLYRYDPVANSWATMAPMPQSAIMASAVYYPTTNKIYVFGGEDAVSGVNYNITRIYDIATNTWSTGANMPDVRSFMASGYNSANGKIYLVSGYNTGQVTSAQPNTWEYDPVANTSSSPSACHFRIRQAALRPALSMATCMWLADATPPTWSLTWSGTMTSRLIPGRQRPTCRELRPMSPAAALHSADFGPSEAAILLADGDRFDYGCIRPAPGPSTG